jgi:hypothetical protein
MHANLHWLRLNKNVRLVLCAFVKKPHIILSLVTVVFFCQDVFGQGFVNLGFENTTFTTFLVNEYSGYYATNATVPGWNWTPQQTFGYGDPSTTVAYNNLALDSPAVTLHGTNDPYGYQAISGKYSILLQGGSPSVPSTSYSSIWQTGQIPSTAQSIIYWGGALQVSFNGQPLSFSDMGDTPNYTIWGANISAYAGQTGQLLFTAPWETTAFLDNIQFSSSAVPEPSEFALSGLGALLLSFRRWTKKR